MYARTLWYIGWINAIYSGRVNCAFCILLEVSDLWRSRVVCPVTKKH